MADDRSMSLGTVFTAKAGPLIAAIRKVREEMEKLNAVMKGQAATGSTRQQAQAVKQQSALVRTAKELKKEIQSGAKFNTTYAQSLKNMVRENGGSVASMKHAIATHQKLRKTMLNQASAMNAAGQAGKAWLQTVNVSNLRQQTLAGTMKQTAAGFTQNVAVTAQATKGAKGLGGVISSLSNQFNLLAGAMKVSAAYMAAGTVFYKLAAGVGAAVSEIIDFDQALKNLSAITGSTGKQLDAMEAKIKDVAVTTKFSTVEVAQGMVLLGQSGFSAEEAVQAMSAVASLATGTMTDMAFTTDLLTTTIRAFNLNAFEATKVADVMANAVNKSKLTVDKLRIAFNYVGPAAHATGTSLEEVSAAMMVLANSGLRASTIGTGLRQILSRLAAPSDKLRESFQEHGIQMEDLDIKTHGFAGVLTNLHKVFVNTKTKVIDSSKAFELFGLRGANAILALTRSITTGEYRRALDQVYEVGTAAEMAETQIKGLALQFKNLADRAKVLAIELGDKGIKDSLGALVVGLRGLVEGVKAFVGTGTGGFITRVTLMNAVVFAFVTTLGLLAKALKYVGTVVGKIGLRMLGGWFGLALAGATTLFSLFKQTEQHSKKGLKDAEAEEMATKGKINMLIYYRETLKSTAEEVKKNSEELSKYRAIIERLKTDFPELSSAIDKAGLEITDLTSIIKDHTSKLLEIESKALIKQFVNLAESRELDLALEGVGNKFTQRLKKIREAAERERKKEIDALREKGGPQYKDESKEVDLLGKAWRQVSNWVSSAKDYFIEAGKGGKVANALLEDQVKLYDEIVNQYLKRASEEGWEIVEAMQAFANDAERGNMPLRDMDKILKLIYARMMEIAAFKAPPVIPDLEAQNIVLQKFWQKASATQKQEVQKIIKDMTAQIATFNKWMESNRASFGVEEKTDEGKAKVWERERWKGIADIRATAYKKVFKMMDEEVLYDFASKQKLARNLTAFIKTVDQEYERQKRNTAKDFAYELALAEDNEGKKEQIRKKFADRALNEEREHASLVVAIHREGDKLIYKSHSDWTEFKYAKDVEESRRAADRQIIELRKQYAARELYEEEFNDKVRKVKLQQAKDEYAIAANTFAEMEMMYNEHSRQYQDSLKAMEEAWTRYLNEVATGNEEVTQELIDSYKEMKDEVVGAWNAGTISAQEYLRIMKELEKYKVITPSDLYDVVVESQQSGWANFKKGIREAMKEIDTFNKMWQKIGKEIFEVISDNLIDAWDEYIEGTKTAKEAFIDFAKSTLKWIAQILMKMALMRAFSFMFGGSMPYVPAAHKGAVIGRDAPPVRVVNPEVFTNARKLHQGLKTNEYPAILKKDESVFTPGQMSMMKDMNRTTNVTVPVTIEGETNGQLVHKLKRNIEEVVLKTLREELR